MACGRVLRESEAGSEDLLAEAEVWERRGDDVECGFVGVALEEGQQFFYFEEGTWPCVAVRLLSFLWSLIES